MRTNILSSIQKSLIHYVLVFEVYIGEISIKEHIYNGVTSIDMLEDSP